MTLKAEMALHFHHLRRTQAGVVAAASPSAVMYKDQRKERMGLLKELLEKGIDLVPLPVLSQDTLILWGDKDEIFPLPLAHQLQRHLGEKSRLQVIKDAGHALQLEKPAKVNENIENFLTGRLMTN